MAEMLYKYTTLESLALILKSRKIRLNPLTAMDDLQEAESADVIKYAQYVFISSWMDEPRESIAMWKLYADVKSGIRIGLPKMPFQKYSYTRNHLEQFIPIRSMEMDRLELSVPLDDMLNDRYTVLIPYYSYLLEDVEYTEDLNLLYPKIFEIQSEGIRIAFPKLGKYKNTYWEFQREKRYVLRFAPVDAKLMQNTSNLAQLIYDAFQNDEKFLDHYDLNIRDDAFEQMEITLSPQFTDGNRVLLEALREKYNPQMNIHESKLHGNVKLQ